MSCNHPIHPSVEDTELRSVHHWLILEITSACIVCESPPLSSCSFIQIRWVLFSWTQNKHSTSKSFLKPTCNSDDSLLPPQPRLLHQISLDLHLVFQGGFSFLNADFFRNSLYLSHYRGFSCCFHKQHNFSTEMKYDLFSRKMPIELRERSKHRYTGYRIRAFICSRIFVRLVLGEKRETFDPVLVVLKGILQLCVHVLVEG